MKPAIELPIPEKPVWEERYARWFLKPYKGQAQFERWFGARWHWWLLIATGLFIMGLMTHYALKFQNHFEVDPLPEMVDAESLSVPQQELLHGMYREYAHLSGMSSFSANVTGGLMIFLGFGIFIYFIIMGLTQSERRGARLIIARLEKQLAEAQAKSPK